MARTKRKGSKRDDLWARTRGPTRAQPTPTPSSPPINTSTARTVVQTQRMLSAFQCLCWKTKHQSKSRPPTHSFLTHSHSLGLHTTPSSSNPSTSSHPPPTPPLPGLHLCCFFVLFFESNFLAFFSKFFQPLMMWRWRPWIAGLMWCDGWHKAQRWCKKKRRNVWERGGGKKKRKKKSMPLDLNRGPQTPNNQVSQMGMIVTETRRMKPRDFSLPPLLAFLEGSLKEKKRKLS